jgi:hypothetical protein
LAFQTSYAQSGENTDYICPTWQLSLNSAVTIYQSCNQPLAALIPRRDYEKLPVTIYARCRQRTFGDRIGSAC